MRDGEFLSEGGLRIDGMLRGDSSYTYDLGKDLDLETGHSDHASAFYMYATQAAEVTVDEETGRVRLLRMAAAHDVGKAINPLNCVAQIEGGLAMGIGAALHEQLVIDDNGKVRNPSFLDYHLLTSLDMPEIIPIIVECAEPEVVQETGRVRLLRMAAAHDVGKAINPLNCVAQIEGGLAMGIGAALHEQLVIDDNGKVRNPSFLDYHLLTSLDMPEIIPIIVECAEPEGPYGAKGLGEPVLAPTPAAIGNAVANALGTRIYDLPLTPERVYWAIQQRKKKEAA